MNVHMCMHACARARVRMVIVHALLLQAKHNYQDIFPQLNVGYVLVPALYPPSLLSTSSTLFLLLFFSIVLICPRIDSPHID